MALSREELATHRALQALPIILEDLEDVLAELRKISAAIHATVDTKERNA